MKILVLSVAIYFVANVPGTGVQAANINQNNFTEKNNQQLLALFDNIRKTVEDVNEEFNNTNENVEGTFQGVDEANQSINKFKQTINGTTDQEELPADQDTPSTSSHTTENQDSSKNQGLPWD